MMIVAAPLQMLTDSLDFSRAGVEKLPMWISLTLETYKKKVEVFQQGTPRYLSPSWRENGERKVEWDFKSVEVKPPLKSPFPFL